MSVSKQLLLSDTTFATTLLAIVLDEYGTEALGWAPETIKMELEEDFGITLPVGAMSKLVAGISVLTSNEFYRRLPVFIQICNALSGEELSDQFDKADAEDCAWGLTEALLLSPPEEDDPFSHEIRAYLGAVVDEEGLINPPDLLKLAISNMPQDVSLGDIAENDPELFELGFQERTARSDDIRQATEQNLSELIEQLSLVSGKSASTLLATLSKSKS